METTQHPPQQACVCIRLRRIAQKVTEFYDNALKPAGVSVSQYSLLINIHRKEGCGTGELAQQVKLEKSTLVRTLQPLIRDGLVTDKSSAKSRQRKLYLTPLGNDVVKTALPLWSKAQEEILSKLKKNHDELMEIFSHVDSWK